MQLALQKNKMKTKQPKLPLSFADYQRLHRVIVTVLNNVDAHTANACIFFSMAGAYILDKEYGLDANVRCGSAFFRVDDAANFVMAFTDTDAFENDVVASHNKAFHAWIECDGVVVDLMAPIFRENIISRIPDTNLRLPRKMFQRPKAAMAESPFDLNREGDFYLETNPDLTRELHQTFMSRAQNGDLVDVCKHWFKRTPKPILQELEMGSNDGIVKRMKLVGTELVGNW